MLIQLYFPLKAVVLNSAKSPLNHKRFLGYRQRTKYIKCILIIKTLAFFIVLEKISNLPIATFQMYLNTYNFTKRKNIY